MSSPLLNDRIRSLTAPPAIVQSVTQSISQKLESMRQQAIQALTGVAANRKILHEIILDLKEHWHEYGFKSAAAATTAVIPRSKSWTNNFLREIESELEIFSQVANSLATSTDLKLADKSETLKKVNSLPNLEAPRSDTSKGGSIDTVAAPDKSTKNATKCSNNGSGAERNETVTAAVVKRRDNGKPIFALPIWTAMEEDYGHLLNQVDVLNRFCPNFHFHNNLLSETKQCMDTIRAWKEYAKNGKMAPTNPSL